MKLSSITNKLSNAANAIWNKISQTNDLVKNTVLAILITTWLWTVTKTEANTYFETSTEKLNFFSEEVTYLVSKWDKLNEIADEFWTTVTELKELNKCRKYWKHDLITKDWWVFSWSTIWIMWEPKSCEKTKIKEEKITSNKIEKEIISKNNKHTVKKWETLWWLTHKHYNKNYSISKLTNWTQINPWYVIVFQNDSLIINDGGLKSN